MESVERKYENKLKQYLDQKQSDAVHLSFQQSCHSVAEAAAAAGADRADFVKNICMIEAGGGLIVAIVKGEDRASTSRVAKALQIARPRMATAEEILARSGYPCGGTPSFGFAAKFIVDPKVFERAKVYTGGGSAKALVHIAPEALLQLNQGSVARVRR